MLHKARETGSIAAASRQTGAALACARCHFSGLGTLKRSKRKTTRG
jgi:hypothetical protein